MRRYEMTDIEWERLKEFFPEKEPGTPGRPPKSTRLVLNGILWIARSGAPRRDLPERFEPWETVYTRYCELVDSGVLIKIFRNLNIDADMQDISLDSTSVKAHQHAAGAEKGVLPLKSDARAAD